MPADMPQGDKTRATSSTSPLFWTLMLLGQALFLIGLLDNINFTVDDVFIPLRYAENYAAGHGLVYNIGERVEGFSNLAWTLMLGGLARAGHTQQAGDYGLLQAAKLIGAACGMLTVLLLSWAAARVRRSFLPNMGRDLFSLAVLGTASTFSMSLWSVAGLETPAAALLATGAGLAFFWGLREGTSQPDHRLGLLLLAGVLAGLLSMVRPEQIFVWALAVAATLPGARRLRTPILASLGLSLAVYFGSVLWRHAYYGAVLPNSVTAKMGGGAMTAIVGLKYMFAGLSSSIGPIALGLLGLPHLLRRGAHWRFLLWLCLAQLLFVAASGGDWMPGFRFLVPVLPLLWLVSIASLVSLVERLGVVRLQPAIGLLAAALCLAAFFNGRALVRAQMPYPTGLKQVTWDAFPTRVHTARELRSVVAPGDTLALFEAGYIPYYNPRAHVLDLSGLMDPGIARLPGRHMQKLTLEYFQLRQPRWYVTMVSMGRPSGDGMTLLGSEWFRSQYQLVRYYDGGRISFEATRNGQTPPLEADLAFALFRRNN